MDYLSAERVERYSPLILYWLLVCLTTNTFLFAQDTSAGHTPKFVWIGPDGSPLPFRDFEEIEDFLASATIVAAEDVGSGVTEPKKILLAKDGIRMNAIFRDVNEFKQRWETRDGIKLNFRDNCIFECAAYELSKLLGLAHVPPAIRRQLGEDDVEETSILRRFESRKGTVQAWVENAFNERDRKEQGLKPPNVRKWAYQFQLLTLFDNLIFNDDRNQTNILIGPDWKLWFIDSTRAFRPYSDLKGTDGLTRCDRQVWERLRDLDDEVIKERLTGLLNNTEIRTLLARRAKLVEYFQKLIDERSEQSVLFDLEDLGL
jgi:hypothetical protein